MRCCDITPMVVKTYEKDGKTYIVYQCRNPKCTNYKNTWEEEIPTNET